ncbi:GD14499 [Drosophila simulans]|uniref:GD14499 n=1 Tax=Drosophila simulans TaxID=7240 RepID=B4QK20_DROSI|nr:GD14499 [Drosophila simulans]
MNMRGMTTRSIWLECLRENAINMRLEHEDLGRRIAVSLASSQKALLDIDNLNQELTKMKDTIHNAISNVLGYENKCCELLLDILIKIVENNDLNQYPQDVPDSIDKNITEDQ